MHPALALAAAAALALIVSSAASQTPGSSPAAGSAASPKPAPAPSGYRAPPANDPCAPSEYANDTYFPKPAHPWQFRAPAAKASAPFNVEVVAKGMERPRSLAFLPDGRMLVIERPGRMRIIAKDGTVSAPLRGVPEMVVGRGAGLGLQDVLLDRDFASNRILYFNYHTRSPDQPESGFGRTVRARLSDAGDALQDLKVIHEGGVVRRLVQEADGTLMSTTGSAGGPDPQSLASANGKVLRFNTDGSIPKDNPFVKDPKALPGIFALGLRDPDGATINPWTRELWTVEHGSRGGDELNVIRAGGNYGFADISYGREYSGELINGGLTAKEGMEQPVYFWSPDIAPSGLMFYTGELFPDWKGNLFVGALVGKHLVRLELKDGKVAAEESLLSERCARFRDIRQGPEGAIYILIDGGELWRLTPKT